MIKLKSGWTRALTGAALFLAMSVSAQVDLTRVGSAAYQCVRVGPPDVLISTHATKHVAIEACQNAWLNRRDGEYEIIATERIRVGFSAALADVYPFGADDSTPPDPAPPPNNAPVWNSTPTPSFTLGTQFVQESYNLLSNVSDADGDALTFVNETGCTLPTGTSINNTTKTIDYDGTGTAGTTTGCVFSADDGEASPVNSSAFSITITDTSGELDYPRVASFILDGWLPGSISTSDLNEWAKADWFVANFGATKDANPTIPGVNLTHQGILAHMRTQNPNIVLTMYFLAHSWFENDGSGTDYRNTIIDELQARTGPGGTDWYAYGTDGTTRYSDWGSGNNRQVHLNWSDSVTADGNGDKVAKYTARRIYNDAWTVASDAGPAWDGFILDVHRTEPNNGGSIDFDQDGDDTDHDEVTIYKEFERDAVNELATFIGGDPIRTGNIGNTWPPATNKESPTPEYVGLNHGGLWEGAMGKGFSADSWCTTNCYSVWQQNIGQVWWQFSDLNRPPPNGYGPGFRRDLPAGLPSGAAEPMVMFGTVVEDTNNAAEDQEFRYHFATCMVTGDGYCNHQADIGAGWVKWEDRDEYKRGNDNVRHYCGQPTEPAVNPATTAANDSGVYWRAFENCLVVVNPDQNGQQTVNISGEGPCPCKKLNGSSSFNDGSNVTNLTLSEANGAVLIPQ